MGLVDATRCHPAGCCHPPGPVRGTGVPRPAARICPCSPGRGVPKNRAPPARPLQDEAAPLGCGSSAQPLAGAIGREKGMEDIWGRGLLCLEAEQGASRLSPSLPAVASRELRRPPGAGCGRARSRRKKRGVSLLRALDSCHQRPFECLAPLSSLPALLNKQQMGTGSLQPLG